MSGHSVTVKRADEVQRGDWINIDGSARRVYFAETREGLVYLRMPAFLDASSTTVTRRPDEPVEVMDQ